MNDCIGVGIRYNMESDYNMRVCRIYSYKYKINTAKLLSFHLKYSGCEFELYSSGDTFAELQFESCELDSFIAGLCDFIIYDVSQFELADMINELPFDLQTRKEILLSSVSYARKATVKAPIIAALRDYFAENDSLVIEGFVMFRMKETREIWERCVEKATEDNAIFSEQYELATLIGELVGLSASGSKAIVLVIRKDGTCTIIDDYDTHIDYPAEAGDSIVGMLVSMMPESICIYDLSGIDENDLVKCVCGIFEGRVRVYRTVLN